MGIVGVVSSCVGIFFLNIIVSIISCMVFSDMKNTKDWFIGCAIYNSIVVTILFMTILIDEGVF